MNKLMVGKVFLALFFTIPASALTGVDADVHIAMPPPVVFAAPPMLVVLPETNAYFVPEADVDIFFFDGRWWRPWEGRWYRSKHYGSGWRYKRDAPSFYRRIPSGWRNDYREHHWKGNPWDHQRISHDQVRENWHTWEKNRHWAKHNNWGVLNEIKQAVHQHRLGARVQDNMPAEKFQPR